MTEEEQYFQDELKGLKPENEKIIASGYFRSYLGDNAGIIAAAGAAGYFLALTETNLYVIQTRAPAFSAPLLENIKNKCIPLDTIDKVMLEPKMLGISHGDGGFVLDMKVSNKCFPSQQTLIDNLAERFNIELRTPDIISGQKKNVLKKIGLIILALSAGVIWAIIK